jgi:hypothetical protein
MEGGAVGHNIEMGLPKDYPCQVWFNLVQQFQRKRFKCDLLSKYALDGPLPNLCPVIPTSNQDGHQAKNRKKGG